jgi:hypothetical protein
MLKNDGGLATSFKSSVEKAKEDEAALLELSSADEWYAAINGVPVGPIRIGELRRKAALGAVTDDSLVWQEGMEEWRPVKTIAELASLVKEAASSGRVSLVSPDPPNVGRASVLPPAPSMRPAPARPTPPRPNSEPPTRTQTAARSNVVPITSRLATAERLDESAAEPASERFSVAPDPFSGGGAAAAAAAPPPAAAVAAAPPPASAQAPVIVQMPRQPNYVGIGMILAMVAFSGVAAWALFFKAPAPVAAPAPPTTVYIHDPSAPAAQTADPNAAPVASASSGAKRTGPVAAAPKASASSAVDLNKLLGGAPGSGPSNPLAGLGNPSGPGPSTGGSSLSADQMETVMRAHSMAVKRVCGSIGGEAKEVVHITIDGNGHVTKAQADGTNGSVGTCLEHEIRNWVFPATGATTGPVDLPFHFIPQ